MHCDLKPDNILWGFLDDDTKIYLIDYGLARLFIYTDEHHAFNSRQEGFNGNLHFSSVNQFKNMSKFYLLFNYNIENSKRDDLISLIYILVFLVNGRLPWMKS